MSHPKPLSKYSFEPLGCFVQSQGASMQRRDFLGVLSGVAAWPLAARAQQPERMRRIGVLMPLAADDPIARARVEAFLQGLQQFGWTDGRNVRIEYRWAVGDADRTRRDAAELVALAPDVIMVTSSLPTVALQQATRIVPIVFVLVADPVGAGIADNMARPGGNATGFTPFEFATAAKYLELLKEIAPGVRRVAVTEDATALGAIGQLAAIRSAAPSFGVELSPFDGRDAGEIERTLAALGGACAKPADLPVQAPTKYELVINLKTAKALGLDVPTSLLGRADEVLE
jgi:putative tryptophan/tyrosine transport system substrate-binding protein